MPSQAQGSFRSLVSSMIMSLNSLDSKISPHSLHSTNSESSSRATICTRGCLHGAMSFWFSGVGDGEDGVINPGLGFPCRTAGEFAGNWRYFRPPSPVVKSLGRSLFRIASSKFLVLDRPSSAASCWSKLRSPQRLTPTLRHLAKAFRPFPVTGCIKAGWSLI